MKLLKNFELYELQWSRLLHLRSGREATRGLEKKYKAEAGMATANFQCRIATQIWGCDRQGRCARDLIIFGPKSRPKFKVATWLRLGLVGLGRDMNFMS